MSSIFSTQNLHTFLRRKNFRPPPPSHGGPPGPRPPPPPPNRGRSPLGRSPLGRGLSLGADCSGAFVSSAIILLESLLSAICQTSLIASVALRDCDSHPGFLCDLCDSSAISPVKSF